MKRSNRTARAGRAALAVGLGAVVALSAASSAAADDGPGHHDGHVYAISNDPAGNALLVFDRAGDGSLTAAPPIPTGGTGTGAGLGSQGAVAVAGNGRVVLAVNAGSDQVSLFAARGDGLVLVETESSGGDLPTSVAVDGHDVYVLNAGADNNIAGFRIGRDGRLDPIPGSIQPLSQPAAGGAQVAFTPDGRHLVVTERFTNRIDTFRVRRGVAEPALVNASTGPTPFGFAFSRSGELLVTNANAGVANGSSVSSYAVDRDGAVVPIDGPVATTESAACWLAVSGPYAYAANAASASLTGYEVDRGRLELLNPDGVTAMVGAGPLDLDTSRDGRYLYQLNGGDDSIGIFAVAGDGALVDLGVVTGLPATAVGLAAT